MLEVMPASEYNRWKAYERLNGPLSARRDDILAGLLMNLIANVNRDPNKKSYDVDEFIPRWDLVTTTEEGRENGRRVTQTRD